MTIPAFPNWDCKPDRSHRPGMARTVFEKADAVALVAEVFRELGYEGATLSRITERTGLGKGSLYHFFPGGKEAMAAEVLAHVDGWFAANVFRPLEQDEPRLAIAWMWNTIDEYFRSGRSICLVGTFSLDATRDRFAGAIRGYFTRWIAALQQALIRAGTEAEAAGRQAEAVVIQLQGALVLSRALHDETVFARTLRRLAAELPR
jgi:TetR/AcrR family transcriptional repressor of lmrAB and yxaGH operons